MESSPPTLAFMVLHKVVVLTHACLSPHTFLLHLSLFTLALRIILSLISSISSQLSLIYIIGNYLLQGLNLNPLISSSQSLVYTIGHYLLQALNLNPLINSSQSPIYTIGHYLVQGLNLNLFISFAQLSPIYIIGSYLLQGLSLNLLVISFQSLIYTIGNYLLQGLSLNLLISSFQSLIYTIGNYLFQGLNHYRLAFVIFIATHLIIITLFFTSRGLHISGESNDYIIDNLDEVNNNHDDDDEDDDKPCNNTLAIVSCAPSVMELQLVPSTTTIGKSDQSSSAKCNISGLGSQLVPTIMDTSDQKSGTKCIASLKSDRNGVTYCSYSPKRNTYYAPKLAACTYYYERKREMNCFTSRLYISPLDNLSNEEASKRFSDFKDRTWASIRK